MKGGCLGCLGMVVGLLLALWIVAACVSVLIGTNP